MGYEVTGSVSYDNLVGGPEVEILTTGVVLASGQGIVRRGTVIGKITASGKGKKTDKASSDGSQVGRYVLDQDVDTTSGDVMAVCYKTGLFNRNALIFGGTSTAADHEDELRNAGIFLKDEI